MGDTGRDRFRKDVRRERWRGGGAGHRLLVSFLGAVCAVVLVGVVCLFFMSVLSAVMVAMIAGVVIAVGGAILEPIGMVLEALAAVLGAIADIFGGLGG